MHLEKKKNRFEIDMCNGSIMNKLISFSIPLMISGILQLGSSRINHSTDQCIYEPIYRNISWSKCACSQVLCGRARERDVGDGAHSDYICDYKRSCDGISWIVLFQRST